MLQSGLVGVLYKIVGNASTEMWQKITIDPAATTDKITLGEEVTVTVSGYDSNWDYMGTNIREYSNQKRINLDCEI